MAWALSLNRFGLVRSLAGGLSKHFQNKCMGGQALDSAKDALGSAFGMETRQQRAANSHAEAMKQWRANCRELHQQGVKA